MVTRMRGDSSLDLGLAVGCRLMDASRMRACTSIMSGSEVLGPCRPLTWAQPPLGPLWDLEW